MARFPNSPIEGSVFPLFTLPDHDGKTVDIGSFRQHHNLVLVFIRNPSANTKILLELAKAADEISALEGIVIAVLNGNPQMVSSVRRELSLSFLLLADTAAEVSERFCPEDVSVYVTDRFREIFMVRHGSSKADVSEILERLAFIEHQCPE